MRSEIRTARSQAGGCGGHVRCLYVKSDKCFDGKTETILARLRKKRRVRSKDTTRPSKSANKGGGATRYKKEEYEKIQQEVLGKVRSQFHDKVKDDKVRKERESSRSRTKMRETFRRSRGAALPSTKNRVRNIERTLARKGDSIPEEVKEKMRERIAQLKAEYEEIQLADKEKKYATRYRKVKFFERKKLERLLSRNAKAIRESDPNSAEFARLNSDRRQMLEDLQYILYFPRDMKYVSVLNNDRETIARLRSSPEFQQKMSRARQIVLAYRALKLNQTSTQTPNAGEASKGANQKKKAKVEPKVVETKMAVSDVRKEGKRQEKEVGKEVEEKFAKETDEVSSASLNDVSSGFVEKMRLEQQVYNTQLSKLDNASVAPDLVAPDSIAASSNSEDEESGEAHIFSEGEQRKAQEHSKKLLETLKQESQDDDYEEQEVPGLKKFLGIQSDPSESEINRRMRYNAAENCLHAGDISSEAEKSNSNKNQQAGAEARTEGKQESKKRQSAKKGSKTNRVALEGEQKGELLDRNPSTFHSINFSTSLPLSAQPSPSKKNLMEPQEKAAGKENGKVEKAPSCIEPENSGGNIRGIRFTETPKWKRKGREKRQERVRARTERASESEAKDLDVLFQTPGGRRSGKAQPSAEGLSRAAAASQETSADSLSWESAGAGHTPRAEMARLDFTPKLTTSRTRMLASSSRAMQDEDMLQTPHLPFYPDASEPEEPVPPSSSKRRSEERGNDQVPTSAAKRNPPKAEKPVSTPDRTRRVLDQINSFLDKRKEKKRLSSSEVLVARAACSHSRRKLSK
eukprot:757196-Hanusia_phi.AAC.2